MTVPNALKIGIVCPYSFDTPGGVQFHVRDLAAVLRQAGHVVEILAPADDETPLEEGMTSAGRAVPLKYNGSTARLSFGPLAASRVRKWLTQGEFDVIHIHEPVVPSTGLLALWAHSGPIVATFHSSQTRSRALQIINPVVRPMLEKITARIAVSEDARRTLIEHLGGDAVVIPNGVEIDYFVDAKPQERWQGSPEAPTIAFLGRLDEPRKGLPVLTAAIPQILEQHPGARFIIAGGGDDGRDEMISTLGALAEHVEFLGRISEDDKAAMLSSVDIYVAPQTGGESFGIVLVEAMAAGTCVVASNLGAFSRVLADGEAGALFQNSDAGDLARVIINLLDNPDQRERYVSAAKQWCRRYDWSIVASQVEAVYETVLSSSNGSNTSDGVGS